MPVEKREKLDFSKCQGLTAEVCCINKSNVSRICKEAETSKDLSAALFMSSRKNIKTSKTETNEYNFEKNILYRIMFGYYNTGKFPTLEKITLSLKEKISYTGLVTSTLMVLKQWLQVQEK